jgi:hypothetical protein
VVNYRAEPFGGDPAGEVGGELVAQDAVAVEHFPHSRFPRFSSTLEQLLGDVAPTTAHASPTVASIVHECGAGAVGVGGGGAGSTDPSCRRGH